MTIVEKIWVPGAAVVPQERGLDYFAPVDGADWSAGTGFYRGFFTSFRLKAGTEAWFHFPISTPVERGGRPLTLASVSLLWEVIDGARIHWLTLQHGGMDRFELTPRETEPPSDPVPHELPEQWRKYCPASARRLTERPMNPPMPLRFGVQLCVGVRAAEAEGTVRFYGAGAAFAEAE